MNRASLKKLSDYFSVCFVSAIFVGFLLNTLVWWAADNGNTVAVAIGMVTFVLTIIYASIIWIRLFTVRMQLRALRRLEMEST